MRLSVKMITIFSAMMLVGLLILSSYASGISIAGANAFTEARFRNMCTSIERELTQEIFMMEMTLRELTENTSFMSALNQIVRDDSADQKMALTAYRTAMNQLLQSPLAATFYRVAFYTRDGDFLTICQGRAEKAAAFSPKTEAAKARFAPLPWLDEADQASGSVLLAPHDDFFTENQETGMYGLVKQIKRQGKSIGYLEVTNRCEELDRLIQFVDNSSVCVEVLFANGQRLFESQRADWNWPETVQEDTFVTVRVNEEGTERSVFHTALENVGLHIYISQDGSFGVAANRQQRLSMVRRALYIMLPTFALIVMVSFGLTRSITKLKKKVQQFPSDGMLRLDDASGSATITSPGDQETYELEQVFNQLMIRLRESTANELTLREGALQAQLSALQTQINPHFIYNTLNIISAKSMESGNYDVIEICDQFAQMLRYSTDTRSRTATLAEEIENVRNYLMLAKTRYEDNLEYTIDLPESMNAITIPKLTLQPLVENAMTHGFDGTNVQRRLSVTGQTQDGKLILEIRDNGAGFSDEMLQSLRSRIQEMENGQVSISASGGHIGLINTCLRLHYYSHGEMHVSIRNDGGAVVTMTMPCASGE